MFNIIKVYNGIECSYHKIGEIYKNSETITVNVWSYVNELSEQNGDDYINSSIFTFNTKDINQTNLIQDLTSKIQL